jgi:hypothetical protein
MADHVQKNEHEGEADDDPDVAQLGDRLEAASRRRAAVVVPPRRDGVVDVLDDCSASNEPREDPERKAAEERQRQRERQQQTRRDRRVEAPDDESPQTRVLPDLRADSACDFLGWPLRRDARTREPARGEEREQPGSECGDQVGEKRHRST